jgi:hypothetical protein
MLTGAGSKREREIESEREGDGEDDDDASGHLNLESNLDATFTRRHVTLESRVMLHLQIPPYIRTQYERR